METCESQQAQPRLAQSLPPRALLRPIRLQHSSASWFDPTRDYAALPHSSQVQALAGRPHRFRIPGNHHQVKPSPNSSLGKNMLKLAKMRPKLTKNAP
jgi:hypothetical protein